MQSHQNVLFKYSLSSEKIFKLVANGKLEQFKQQDNVDLQNDRDYSGGSYLHRAIPEAIILQSSVEMIHYLLTKCPQLTLVQNNLGQTPLCLACAKFATPQIIYMLIQACPSVINHPDKNGITPLHHIFQFGLENLNYPIQKQFETTIDLLVLNGADVNSEDSAGNSILQTFMLYSYQTHHNIMSHNEFYKFRSTIIEKMVLKYKTNVQNVLWSLVENIDEAKILLNADVNKINEVDKNNLTPLDYVFASIKNKHVRDEILIMLLNNGAQVEYKIAYVIKLVSNNYRNFSILEYLLETNPNYDINTRDEDGKTLLMKYGEIIDIFQLEKLLNLGADPKLQCNKGDTVLCTSLDAKVIKKLLQLGVNPMHYSDINVNVIAHVFDKIVGLVACKLIDSEWFEILNLVLESPYCQNVLDKQVIDVYNYVIFDCMFDIETWKRFDCDNAKALLECLIKHNSNINTYVRINEVPSFILTFENAKFDIFGDAIVRLLNKIGYESYTNVDFDTVFGHLKTLVHTMLDVFQSNPNEKCLSALAVYLLVILCDDCEYSFDEDEEVYKIDDNDKLNQETCKFKLFKEILAKSGNVNSTVLDISNNAIMDQFKNKLQVPDALLIAVISDKPEYAEQLLDHWWGPPLALFAFCPKLSHRPYVTNQSLDCWLRLFVRFGGIPHDETVFKMFKKEMMEYKVALTSVGEESWMETWRTIQEQMTSPLTLQELCKYAVRKEFSKQVSYPGRSLPQLLKEQLPPLLHSVVLHNPTPKEDFDED